MILQEPVAYIPGYISCARTSPGGICGSSVFYDILLQQFERIYDSPGRKRLDRWLRREMVERVAVGGGVTEGGGVTKGAVTAGEEIDIEIVYPWILRFSRATFYY